MAERKIGSLTYRAEPMPAMQTVTMGRRVANLAGPSLPALAGAMQKQGDAQDAAALAALGTLAANLDERFDALIGELARMAQVKWNGAWDQVDPDIPEHVPDAGTLLLLAFFVLEVNFKSFFSGPLAKLLASRTPASHLNS